MKRTLRIAVAAIVLAAPPVGAQLSPFSGWNLGLDPSRATATQTGGAIVTSALGDGDYSGNLQAAYGFPIGARYQLGFGLAWGRGDFQADTLGLRDRAPSLHSRNRYSLYAEPGYTLGDNTLLYGKLAYLGGRGEESYGSGIFDKAYSGLGLGAGMRTRLGERLYLQVELLYGDYEWTAAPTGALRPLSTMGSIGLGWRF